MSGDRSTLEFLRDLFHVERKKSREDETFARIAESVSTLPGAAVAPSPSMPEPFVPVDALEVQFALIGLQDASRVGDGRVYFSTAERDRLVRLIERLWEELNPSEPPP